MARLKVSEALVQILAQTGVKYMFGVVGDALNSITESIRVNGKIQWIGVRHEETAAFAAGAQAQLNGELGVCAGTVGPGAIHLLNGLYDTKHSHAPVLAITGQIPVVEMGTDYFQEVDLQKLFDDVSVYNHTVVSPGQMPRVAHLAIQTALTRRGVAHLCIPGDVGQAELSTNDISQDFYRHFCESTPTTEELQKAAELLNDAKRVTILAGIGTHNARKELLQVAQCLQAPIVYALRGKEALEYDNPFAVGMTGLLGTPAGADALEDADALLLVGTDFPYRDWIPEGKKVVQIDRNADRLSRRTHIGAGLVGDARCTLKSLLPLLMEKKSDHLDSAQKRRNQWKEKELKKMSRAENKKPIRPEWLAKVISNTAGDDAIFCADTGMCVVWAARYLEMRKGRRLLGSFNHGSMANALPQAIGAQLLYPERQVITFSGDGGLTMLMGDLLTAVSYQLPIKIFVFNNHRFGMVKLEMEVDGYPEFGTILKNPDFAKVGEALGFTGIRVTEPGELQEAVRRALSTTGPVLVDVETNPESLSFPPKFMAKEAVGFAIGKVKEFLLSYGDKE